MEILLTLAVLISITDLRYIFSKESFLEWLTVKKFNSSLSFYQQLEFYAKSRLKLQLFKECETIPDSLRTATFLESKYIEIDSFCSDFATIKNRFLFVIRSKKQRKLMVIQYGYPK